MCVDCHAINKIITKYHHPIPRLDDLFYEFYNAWMFFKIDLKKDYH